MSEVKYTWDGKVPDYGDVYDWLFDIEGNLRLMDACTFYLFANVYSVGVDWDVQTLEYNVTVSCNGRLNRSGYPY